MKVIFFGTPQFAVPTLEALVASGRHRPLLVVSQPSRPVGRRREPQAPPVVVAAQQHGLEVEQPEKVRRASFLERCAELQPDAAVVVAFGQIFRRSLLELPRLGCINLHGSLLPRYRGAAPIQAAIAAGDRETGVTTMRMERGLDSGPILQLAKTPIGPDETTLDLAPRLARIGAELMVQTLDQLAAGTLEAQPQDDALATYAPRLERHDGKVDWSLPAGRIYDRWRALTPWPGLSSSLTDSGVKLVRVRPGVGAAEAAPGTFLGLAEGAMDVACGDDTILRVERLQRSGRKALDAVDFVNGERLHAGVRFGVS